MKKADPYQPTWSTLWNSAVMIGMAVATMVYSSILLEVPDSCRVLLGKTHHVQSHEEHGQQQSNVKY